MVGSLDDGSRQCLAIHLLVLVQRDGVNLHRGSRNHVGRLLLADEGVQLLDVHLLITDDIGCNVLAAVLVVEGLDGGILDAWELADDSLHLLQLDAEATNLNLSVTTPHKLDVAISQIAHDVARTIDTAVFLVGRKRICQIGLCGLLRAVQIATAYLWATDPKFTYGTYRQTVELLIDDIQAEIVERLADGGVLLKLLQRVCGSEDRTFRRTIAVVQLICSGRCERQDFLATHGEMTQRMVVEVHRELTAHLCGHERMGNTFTVEILVQVGQVETDVLANDIDCSATGQGGVHIHHTGIEAVAGVCGHLVAWLQSVVTMVPVAETYQVAMFQLTALRRTCRT